MFYAIRILIIFVNFRNLPFYSKVEGVIFLTVVYFPKHSIHIPEKGILYTYFLPTCKPDDGLRPKPVSYYFV